jgi:hypothetical protein
LRDLGLVGKVAIELWARPAPGGEAFVRWQR